MRRHDQRAAILASAVLLGLALPRPSVAAPAPDCPNGGVVRFGVEPYDTSAKLVPIYDHIGKALGDKIGCEVKVYRQHQLQCRDRGDAQRQA